MSPRMSCLAMAALALLPALHFAAPAARACQTQPHPASLCAIIPASAEVREKPNGRVAYAASGKVLVAGHSKDGLWARIKVPCVGYSGWIARADLSCEEVTASAPEPATR